MTILAVQPILPPEQLSSVDFDLVLDPDEMQLRISRSRELPDPTAICCAVAHAAVEAFHGARPVQQLARLVSPKVYEQLSQRANAQIQLNIANGNASVANRGVRNPEIRTSRPTTRIVRAIVSRVSPVAAEATVIIKDGPRVRAAALRAEEFRGRWRIAVLQIG